MDDNELDYVGIGAPKAADPMDGPSGDSDIGTVRPAITPRLARADTAVKLPLLARSPKTGHHARRDARLLETQNLNVFIGNHI